MIAKPNRWQKLQGGAIRSAVGDCDADDRVGGIDLAVLNLDIEVAVLGKDAGIDQFELGLGTVTGAVLIDQFLIRESLLGVLVEALEVGVGWCAVEVPVILLDIFAVVALTSG